MPIQKKMLRNKKTELLTGGFAGHGGKKTRKQSTGPTKPGDSNKLSLNLSLDLISIERTGSKRELI